MQKILRILPSWLFLFSLALAGNQAQVDVHQLRQQGLLPHSWQHFPVWAHQNYQQAADNIQPQPSTIRPSWPPSPSHQPVWPPSSNHQNPHGVLRRYPMPPEWPFHGRLPPLEMRQAPRKGLSRLLMLGGLNSGSDEQPELEPPAEQQPAQTSQPQLSSQQDMNRPPLANNMERYMPLLATKHRPKARNATAVGQRPAGKGAAGHHLVDSREHSHWRHGAAGPEEAEDEEGEGESLEAASGRPAPASELGPCVTANCRTWITITIPSELVGIPPGLGLPGEAQQKPDGQQPKPPSKPTISPSKTMPPFPPLPMPSRSRGQPAPKNRPSQGTFPSSSAKPPTTREQPPDFVFSTKWILPVNGLSIRPNGTVTATSPASPSAQITTATPTNPWANRPFTIRPKAKVPAAASSTASPPEPRERPTVKSRPAGKPWTHSGGSTGSSASAFGQTVPKARPAPPAEKVPAGSRPPTPDSTIEQAAIWASTELIDAIREALAKFRATLNRRENDGDHQDEQHRRPGEDLELDEAEMQLRQQLQAAWDSLRGTWLEHAVTKLAQQADALGGGDGHRGVAKWPLESAKQQLGPEKTEVDQRRAKRRQIIGRTE